ncbi:YihY/virulence factor BrkB family protein [Glycocaulis sp.]|uniref:YihY/virulence factor BrkB family protein n=1 Tax=Glycocaulis sp. TaxID=1969725 RepID=UPI003F72468F
MRQRRPTPRTTSRLRGLSLYNAKSRRDIRLPRRERARARQAGRGRRAATPRDIPLAGWRDILVRSWGKFLAHRLLLIAAGLTFFALLGIFPALTAIVSVYGLFTDPANIAEQLSLLEGFVPGGALELLATQMTDIASRSDGALTFGLIAGLAVALWTANAGMRNLFNALNIVYEEEETRGMIRMTLISLAFTACVLVFAGIVIALIIVLPVALELFGLGAWESWILLARWPALFVIVTLGLSIAYRWGPSRRKPRWRWVTPGGVFATSLWMIAAFAVSWYVENFGQYDDTYGSFGAGIGFMMWLWVSSIIVLLGAQLNAEQEHQTARDTTVPPDRPLGQRGATVADTVGRATGAKGTDVPRAG